jgi:hypothetical protein
MKIDFNLDEGEMLGGYGKKNNVGASQPKDKPKVYEYK